MMSDKIDWGKLYKEFGLHTPDANGRYAVPTLPLTLAIDVSEQEIQQGPHAAIEAGVEAGALEPVHTTKGDGEEVIRGYRCPEVQP